MTGSRVGTREEWLAARVALLEQEKEHTRRSDELARLRRELPWVPVGAEYRFDTEDGSRTLAELFDGRPELIVYHFMFGPNTPEGCTAAPSPPTTSAAPSSAAPSPRRSAGRAPACTSPPPGARARSTYARPSSWPSAASRCATASCTTPTRPTYRGTDALNPTWQLLDRTATGRVLSDGWPVRRVPID